MTLYEITRTGKKDNEYDVATNLYVLEDIFFVAISYFEDNRNTCYLKIQHSDHRSIVEYDTKEELIAEYNKLKKALANLNKKKKGTK